METLIIYYGLEYYRKAQYNSAPISASFLWAGIVRARFSTWDTIEIRGTLKRSLLSRRDAASRLGLDPRA